MLSSHWTWADSGITLSEASMKTFPAYKTYNMNNPEDITGLVWWDGKHIRTNSSEFMRDIKNEQIPSSEGSLFFKDGEKFFKLLPSVLRRGYTAVEKCEVDEKGKIV